MLLDMGEFSRDVVVFSAFIADETEYCDEAFWWPCGFFLFGVASLVKLCGLIVGIGGDVTEFSPFGLLDAVSKA